MAETEQVGWWSFMAKLVLFNPENIVVALLQIDDNEQDAKGIADSYNQALNAGVANHSVIPDETIQVGVGKQYYNGIFREVKPFPSWSWDDEFGWVAPIPHPHELDGSDLKEYRWDETEFSWVKA
jgi:hypothetical protein